MPRPVQADPRIAEHLPLARAMARKFLHRMGGMLELDDLTSIAMTAIWQAAPLFDESRGTTFGQYARSCAWAELRRQQRQIWIESRRAWLQQSSIHPQDDDDRGIDLPSLLPSPFALLSEARASRRLREKVATLPDRQRASIELCFFDDMTLAEAGAVSGVSKQAVEQHQRKALASLSYRLREEEEGSVDDNG